MAVDLTAFENTLGVMADRLVEQFSMDEIPDWASVPIEAKRAMNRGQPNTETLRLLSDAAAEFLRPPDARKENGELDEEDPQVVRMERLTTAWLGLYFMGVPHGALWERVCHIADDVGSYANSVCAYKAIGDVFRFARQIYIRDFCEQTVKPARAERTAASAPRNCNVVVLTRTPMILDGSLSLDDSATECMTHKPGDRLGRLYLMLQLGLYVRQGLPLQYVVPINAVSGRLKITTTAKAQEEADRMLAWLRKVLPEPNPWQTVMLTHEDANTVGVPTFVLGYRSGVATVEVMRPDNTIAFAANRLGKTLVTWYRAKAAQFAGHDLLARSAEDRKDLLVRDIWQEPKTITVVPHVASADTQLSEECK